MRRSLLTMLLCSACMKMNEEGWGTTEESSSSSTSDNPTSVTSADTTEDPTISDPSESTDPSGAESSSHGDDPSSGEDSSTTTGEVLKDYALEFDGKSYARKVEDGGDFQWPASDFTVEVWAEIRDTDATGVIFDTTNAAFSSGWVLYLHNDWHAIVFSFFDENHQNQVVMGPLVEDIGIGWHHLSATKYDNTVTIHVDGATMTTQTVPSSLSFDNSTLWTMGGSQVADPAFHLRDASVDDVRITGFARYGDDFDPPPAYDADDTESVILMLLLDAGEGDLVSDEIGGVDFNVENPAWGSGNAE